ncbi:hypothetical protein ACFV3R_32395 [Streptomyces sp. NPDC059740]|uniref:hypothetical protein n=1 Tax=Streptomyces sp. NPDC059740 TaxID=3346926 RepID=UPI00365D309D
MRNAALIVGAVGLASTLLVGCGSGNESRQDDSSPTSAGTGTSTSPRPSGSAVDGKALAGTWRTQSGEDQVTLAFVSGTAVLNVGKKTACVGGAKSMGGMTMLAMTCTDGDKTRNMGTVRRSGERLTVDWENGPTDVLTRTSDKADIPNLPSGLPTLPGDAPTSLPSGIG